jgi:hypothetical protein
LIAAKRSGHEAFNLLVAADDLLASDCYNARASIRKIRLHEWQTPIVFDCVLYSSTFCNRCFIASFCAAKSTRVTMKSMKAVCSNRGKYTTIEHEPYDSKPKFDLNASRTFSQCIHRATLLPGHQVLSLAAAYDVTAGHC